LKLEQSFEVGAPVKTVWEALIDVERVATCLPGAEVTQANADGSYQGTFQVKLGPTTAAYTGKLSMESLDVRSRTATMKATGRERRGQGSANATIVSTMHEQDGVTRVEFETDFTITGQLARFGRGELIQDISNRLLRDFASCLHDSLEPEGGCDARSGSEATAAASNAGEAAQAEAALETDQAEAEAAPPAAAKAATPTEPPGGA
jgi:carbon monoxide dehydrogenase subunit G